MPILRRFREEEVEQLLSGVGGLGSSMATMREEYVRYSQYLAATENLKHIFTVPESIEKTQKLIADNNLLYAHQVCVEMIFACCYCY